MISMTTLMRVTASATTVTTVMATAKRTRAGMRASATMMVGRTPTT
jgi:hypothetical protein